MRVLVDFNEVYDDKFVWAVVRRDTVAYQERPHQLGDWVELYDHDGTSCLGQIVEMTDQTIDCEIDWATFEYMITDIPLFQGDYQPVTFFTQGGQSDYRQIKYLTQGSIAS